MKAQLAFVALDRISLTTAMRLVPVFYLCLAACPWINLRRVAATRTASVRRAQRRTIIASRHPSRKRDQHEEAVRNYEARRAVLSLSGDDEVSVTAKMWHAYIR